MLYLVSVGLVAAAIIGVCFGIGFFLLASPASETITGFDRKPSRVYGNAPDAGREAVLVSRETGMSHSVEVDSVPEPASSSAVSPASPTPLASPPPFAAEAAVLPAGGKGHPARYGHGAHTRTASQHSRPSSARNVPTLTPPQSPFAQTLMPPRTSSFGQILTQLTGQTKPIGQTLTPPQAEQPDPFAQRIWNK